MKIFTTTGTFQPPGLKKPDSNRMPRGPHSISPLPCHDHGLNTYWWSPLIMRSCPIPPNSLLIKLEVSILWVGRSVAQAWTCHLPWLPAPIINFSLSLFQILTSSVTGFSCDEFIWVGKLIQEVWFQCPQPLWDSLDWKSWPQQCTRAHPFVSWVRGYDRLIQNPLSFFAQTHNIDFFLFFFCDFIQMEYYINIIN